MGWCCPLLVTLVSAGPSHAGPFLHSRFRGAGRGWDPAVSPDLDKSVLGVLVLLSDVSVSQPLRLGCRLPLCIDSQTRAYF